MKVPRATATRASQRFRISTPLYGVLVRRTCTLYRRTRTLYSCQVPASRNAERLTKAAVADRALQIGDAEGVEAITVRRLATDLGVTPMALYWHFKNKDELLLGLVDHVMGRVRADRTADDPWE